MRDAVEVLRKNLMEFLRDAPQEIVLNWTALLVERLAEQLYDEREARDLEELARIEAEEEVRRTVLERSGTVPAPAVTSESSETADGERDQSRTEPLNSSKADHGISLLSPIDGRFVCFCGAKFAEDALLYKHVADEEAKRQRAQEEDSAPADQPGEGGEAEGGAVRSSS